MSILELETHARRPRLSFFVACVPPTANHQNKRIVRRGKFASLADAPELVAAKQTLDALLLPHQPAEPIPAPARVTLEFTWPWLASTPKRTKAAYVRVRKVSAPDCTNLAKTLEDRLAALRFIANDAGDAEVVLRKWHGDAPGIAVTIEALEAGEQRPSAPVPLSALEPSAVPASSPSPPASRRDSRESSRAMPAPAAAPHAVPPSPQPAPPASAAGE